MAIRLLTWSRAAKNAVHIRPKNTISNRFVGKTCSSLFFHDAPGRASPTGAPFCVVVVMYVRLEAGTLFCVRLVQLRAGTLQRWRNGMRAERERKRLWGLGLHQKSSRVTLSFDDSLKAYLAGHLQIVTADSERVLYVLCSKYLRILIGGREGLAEYGIKSSQSAWLACSSRVLPELCTLSTVAQCLLLSQLAGWFFFALLQDKASPFRSLPFHFARRTYPRLPRRFNLFGAQPASPPGIAAPTSSLPRIIYHSTYQSLHTFTLVRISPDLSSSRTV